jgi:hypothetical protein
LTGAATITPTDATTATTRTAVDEELSHAPSELMRFGYAFMGAGLAIIKIAASHPERRIPSGNGRSSHLPADRHLTPGVPPAQISRPDAVPELYAPIGQIRGLVHIAHGHRDIRRRS